MTKSIVFCLALFCCISKSLYAQATVALDTSTKFQTIEGWGQGGGVFSALNLSLYQTAGQALQDTLDDQYLRDIALDLGLTGSRMWEVGPRADGTGIDLDGNCDSLDWTKFQAAAPYATIAPYAVYFKQLVEAQGLKTNFYSSPTYPTSATMFKPWVQYDPGERALQIWANAIWWKQQGIDINYAVIQNEPQYGSSWNTQVLSDDVAAVGPRLATHGLGTKVQWAEGVDPHTTWNYDTNTHRDNTWWSYVGRLSYHRYGTDDPYRSYLADSARVHGITTAQTEMGNPGIEDIVSDLLLGNVTYWEVGFTGAVASTPGGTNWLPGGTYYRMRQLLHYARQGDVRVGATSSDSMVQVVAFKGRNGIATVVICHRTNEAVTISGLRPGQYGLSESPNGASAYQEYGIKTVGSDGTVSFTVGASNGQTATGTLYPYVGPNHAPAIEWLKADSGYVIAPQNSVHLSGAVADAELDPLTYAWSVYREPAGANANFTSPTALNTTVTNLTTGGLYIFMLSVSDGINTTTRKLFLQVYDSNSPPWLWQSGFRFSQPYGLVFANPQDTTHANVELPTSSCILQVGISDLANSNFTGRGKWRLVSEPPGANAVVDSTIYIYISIRANVSNMTVPGDYVFQCNVTVPGNPDLVDRVICTVHSASSGPVINSITATPGAIELPQDTLQLSGSVSDTSGQLLRYWWEVKSIPPGANPVFDHQGLAQTTVRRLDVPGPYTFTLRTFDDLHMATKDVGFSVSVGGGKGKLALEPATIIDFGTVDTGSFSEALATIQNVGSGPITVNSITTSLPFAVRPQPTPPFAVAPSDSVHIVVSFLPHNVGLQTGILIVSLSDGSSDTIALKGVGKAPASNVATAANGSRVPHISIVPNPSTVEADCNVTLSAPSEVTIAIFSSDGKEVGKEQTSLLPAGETPIKLNVSQLCSGEYFVRIHPDEEEDVTLPLIIQH